MNVELSNDTEIAMTLLIKLCESINAHFEIISGDRKFRSDNDKKSMSEAMANGAKVLLSFITDLEEEYIVNPIPIIGTSYLDKLSKGDFSEITLKLILESGQSLANRLVLIDSARRVHESSDRLHNAFSKI